jgi:hypothetical protein
MCHVWKGEDMFGAEIGQYSVSTDEIKSWRCNHLASRNAVCCGVLSSAEFFGSTISIDEIAGRCRAYLRSVPSFELLPATGV